MTVLHLQPAPGRVVRHPDARLLAKAGEIVPASTYWLRRWVCGDAVQVTPPLPHEPRPERAHDPEHRRGSGKASP